MATSPPSLVQDLENASNAPLQPKALYAGDVYQGQPVVVVTQSEINIAADSGNAIHLDPKFGILLSGKSVSLSCMPDQVSLGGGYWRLNPMLLSCVPSTTPTPIPVLVQSTPTLFQNQSAVSGAQSYLMSNSDIG
jgi:hypothetical protein